MNEDQSTSGGPETVVVAGASGLIGRALVAALEKSGKRVVRLVRRAPGAGEARWDPAAGELAPRVLAGATAVVNLSGENIGRRWTAPRREAIRSSRIEATRTLVTALRAASPRPAVLVNASAVGFYGDRCEEIVDEHSTAGTGFLAEVCAAWETEARAAEALGVRVAMLRFGTVLTRDGGALAKMLPLFRLGLGGRLGSGRQWMSWVALHDLVRAVEWVIADARCVGVFNVVAPEPVRNADFTRALARSLHRPALLPAPRWALRAVLGGMADEALLASTRAVPRRLEESGFRFEEPTLAAALRESVSGE